MLQTRENTVRIEGILSEIDIKYGSFEKNGATVKSIGGVIKVRVDQKINGADTTLEVPVHMFASELTNAGKPNPAYESIEKVMNDFTSIAAGGIENADRIRITRGQLQMNEYYGQTGNLVSFPRITASFVTKVKREEFKPEATFTAIFVVGTMSPEVANDGTETGRFCVKGVLPQYGGKVDVIPFYAASEDAINFVTSYWNQFDTVKVNGKLNFSSKTEVFTENVDFGDPVEKTRTISVSELLITGGTNPLEGEFAYDVNEVQAALADRKVRLENLKAKKATAGTSGKAPGAGKANKYTDLGF